MRRFLTLLLAAFVVSVAPSAAEESFGYTYDGNPQDEAFRAVMQALFDEQGRAPEVQQSQCAVRPAGEAKKLEAKFRKKHGLPAETALSYASCEVVTSEICHRSFYSGKDKCNAGEADLFFDVTFDEGGNSAKSRAQLAFFSKKGRAVGKIVQIFSYDYTLAKTEEGWKVTGKTFVKMFDL